MIRHELLREYFRSPSPDTLIPLLNACTDPVYNICVQVLRNRQDAEDAAQTALIKIFDQVMATAEIRDFDRLLYRVALNTALKARLQRERRLSREFRRTPMPGRDGVPDEVRGAVYEAIAELDDDARCLVVQHFMEGRTLEELGRERGCSAVAVWKRIDRAKSRLREALEKAGSPVLRSGFAAVLESSRLVRAPSSLSDAVAAKAAAFALGTKSGATLALGGLAMSAKGVPVAFAVALAIALFVVGAGGSYWFSCPDPAKEVLSAVVPGSANRRVLASAPSRSGSAEELAAPFSSPFASPREPMDADGLAAGLQKVGALLREARKVHEENGTGAQELYKRVNRHWQAIRDLAFRDASVLFAFLREPANSGIVEDLVELVFSYELGSNGAIAQEADELPKAVIAGLAQMIADGTKPQKLAVLSRLPYVGGEAQILLASACIDLLGSETDSEVLSTILSQFHAQDAQFCAKLEDRLDLVRNLWQVCILWEVRGQCLAVLAKMKGASGEALFIEKLQEALQSKDPMLPQYLSQILSPKLDQLPLGEEDRYIPILKSAMTLTANPLIFEGYLELALQLPPIKTLTVMDQARTQCPTAALQEGVDRTIGLLRSGETRRAVLRHALNLQR